MLPQRLQKDYKVKNQEYFDLPKKVPFVSDVDVFSNLNQLSNLQSEAILHATAISEKSTLSSVAGAKEAAAICNIEEAINLFQKLAEEVDANRYCGFRQSSFENRQKPDSASHRPTFASVGCSSRSDFVVPKQISAHTFTKAAEICGKKPGSVQAKALPTGKASKKSALKEKKRNKEKQSDCFDDKNVQLHARSAIDDISVKNKTNTIRTANSETDDLLFKANNFLFENSVEVSSATSDITTEDIELPRELTSNVSMSLSMQGLPISSTDGSTSFRSQSIADRMAKLKQAMSESKSETSTVSPSSDTSLLSSTGSDLSEIDSEWLEGDVSYLANV